MPFKMIEIGSIVPNKLNVRKDKSVSELAESIRQLGLINPISVVEFNGKYRIIAGERRYWALKELEWKQAPCCIFGKEYEREQILAENLVRKNLSLVEEAEAVDSFLSAKHGEDYLALLYSPEKSSEKISILSDLKALNLSSIKVNNLAKVLFMDENIKGKISKDEIKLEDAVKLSNVQDVSLQREIAKKLSSKSLVDRNQGRIEMEAPHAFSVGDSLIKIRRNVGLSNDYLGFAFKGFEGVDANKINAKKLLNLHKSLIGEIMAEIVLLKENIIKLEKDFKEITK